MYLSSYKLGDKTDELKKQIEKGDNKICLVINSRDQWEGNERYLDGIKRDTDDIESLGFKVTRLDLRKFFGKEKELREFMKSYNAVYVIGGNTFVLRRAMKFSGFDKFIKSKVRDKDFLYIGYSAGICVLSKDLRGLAPCDEPEVDPYNSGEPIYKGIGLIDYLPLPHYKSENPRTKGEAVLIDKCLEYCEKHSIKYKTICDGDVILEGF